MQLAAVHAIQGRTAIQGYCFSDSGLNAIDVRGNIAAGRSSTTVYANDYGVTGVSFVVT